MELLSPIRQGLHAAQPVDDRLHIPLIHRASSTMGSFGHGTPPSQKTASPAGAHKAHTPEQTVKGRPSSPQDATSGPCSISRLSLYQNPSKTSHTARSEAIPTGP